MRESKVFLNYTKFKTETLVPIGFLVGAHPGHLRRDEAEEELRGSLGLSEGELPFQLTSRTISVPIQEGGTQRYSFQATVIETSVEQANKLRECFYQLSKPAEAPNAYPYTGQYQFVPLLKSKEWTIQKIYQLAQFHVSIINNLKTIYLVNLQDINNVVNTSGDPLMQGFLSMTMPNSTREAVHIKLLHSIHNTGKPTTKVALVKEENYQEALDQLANLENLLTTSIHSDFHSNVFVEGARPGISGYQADTISSCNYSSYASELLSTVHPQDSESPEPIKPKKRFRPVQLTYASAVAATPQSVPAPAQTVTSVSSLSSNDMDKLYEEMSRRLSTTHGDLTKLNINDLEQKVQQTSTDIQAVKQTLEQSIQNISSSVTQLATKVDRQNQEIMTTVQELNNTIERQNIVILGIQQEFKDNITLLTEKYTQALQFNGSAIQVTPSATTRINRQWGEMGT